MLLVLLEKVQRNEDLLMVDYDMMGANVMIGFCVMRIEMRFFTSFPKQMDPSMLSVFYH